MTVTRVSKCGRFVVAEGLHLDRAVFARLQRWADDHHVSIQDAIQLAICSFDVAASTSDESRVAPTPASSTRLMICAHSAEGID